MVIKLCPELSSHSLRPKAFSTQFRYLSFSAAAPPSGKTATTFFLSPCRNAQKILQYMHVRIDPVVRHASGIWGFSSHEHAAVRGSACCSFKYIVDGLSWNPSMSQEGCSSGSLHYAFAKPIVQLPYVGEVPMKVNDPPVGTPQCANGLEL